MRLWQLLSSFPSAVPTVLLGVLMVYWIVSIATGVDVSDHVDLDLDVSAGHAGHAGHADHTGADGPGLHTLAGYLVALGLGGLPLSIVASVLVFVTWLTTALMHRYLLGWVPTAPLQWLAGAATLLFAAVLSIPVTARLLKPTRALFIKHGARRNASLVGLACRIVTQSVSEDFGRAEVDDAGTALNIRVWAASPNTLARNCAAIIVAYDESSRQYEVQAAPL